MFQGQVFLKGGGWHFSYFFQGLSLLHFEITLPFAKLCYGFEEIFFFATMILCNKIILSYLKMNLKISHKLR